MRTTGRVFAVLLIIIGIAHGLRSALALWLLASAAELSLPQTVLYILASMAPALVLVVSGIILYRAEVQESDTEPADGWMVLGIVVTYMGALLAAFLVGGVVIGQLPWLSDIANSMDPTGEVRHEYAGVSRGLLGVAIVAMIPALFCAFRREGQQRLHARIALALFIAFGVHWAVNMSVMSGILHSLRT